jgi:hypothetical protein
MEANRRKSRMKKKEIPTISIDMDRKCTSCGDGGATDGGLCLKCIADKMVKEKKIKTHVMLNKNNFSIGSLAPPPVDESTSLCCVSVHPDKTIVTDGKILIEITGAECETSYLPFEDVMPETDFDPFTMPAEEAIALSKMFVKSDTPDGNILAVQPENGRGASAFALRQARKEKIFRMDRPKGQFPNYEVIFDSVKDEIASVTIDLNLFIPLLRHLKAISDGPVRIGIYGTEKPVRLDCIDQTTKQSARALIMPMKT